MTDVDFIRSILDSPEVRTSRKAAQEQNRLERILAREELRAKLAVLDENINFAEAEVEKLKGHEEHIRAMEKSGEELLERYSELVPTEIENLSPAERRHIYQLLRVEVSVPKEGEIRIRLPFLPDNRGVCRDETAYR